MTRLVFTPNIKIVLAATSSVYALLRISVECTYSKHRSGAITVLFPAGRQARELSLARYTRCLSSLAAALCSDTVKTEK
jgi:hypothetical protein